MLPHHETFTLLLTVTEAVDLADAGEVADGDTALLAGLHRAKELRNVGAEWAGEFGGRWAAEMAEHWEAPLARLEEQRPIGRA